MIKDILAFISGAVIFSTVLVLGSTALADTIIPIHPSCSEFFGQPGDKAHYDSGIHQIVGAGLVEGSDDVYTLENSNFLQCFCSIDDEGIQTFWWWAEDMTEAERNEYVSQGWYLENGLQWNLADGLYLAKNADYYCGEPSPTPTPTATPTPTVTPTVTITPTVTPTPTTTPTITPTPYDEDESRCVGLSASPTEGTAPLTVKFTGSGYDKNGDIKEYEFDFGDDSGFQPKVWKTTDSEAAHRYENPGTFVASLKVKDQGDQWRDGNDDCKKEIKVTDKPQVLAATAPKGLPETGLPGMVLFGSFVGGPLGVVIYRRFRLV
jgi:PKD repeat protein